jgi:hypothetical protein
VPDRTEEGALYWRDLGEGCEIVVYPMTYGKARLCYSEGGTIVNAFCYAKPDRAIEAAKAWDGEGDPLDGWHRNPFTGRRREDGDPNKEYVRA